MAPISAVNVPAASAAAAPGKTPFVAAVETTPEGKLVRLKLRRVASFCSRSVSTFAKRSLDPTSEVISDGLACFGAVTDAGCSHQIVKTGSGAAAARTPTFRWVNTALGNIKAAIVGTYRAIHEKHVPRYLAEYEYGFNRRYDLAAMLPRLTVFRSDPTDALPAAQTGRSLCLSRSASVGKSWLRIVRKQEDLCALIAIVICLPTRMPMPKST